MTFAELQSYVLDRLDIPAEDVKRLAQVKLKLRQSHLRIVTRYKLKAGLAALSTIANDPLVDLPDDFGSVESLWRSGQQLFPVTRSSLAASLSAAASTVTGPYAYSFEAPDRLRILPAPTETADAALTLDYLSRAIPLANDTDVPDAVPEEWHDLIGEMAVETIAISEGDTQAAQAAGAHIAEIRSDMDRIIANRGGPGQSQIPVAGYIFRSRTR